MFCAKCLSQIDAGSERCIACGENPLLFGRYRLDRPIPASEGPGRSRSYRVTQVEDGMLYRACAVDLSMRDAAAITMARASAKSLLDFDHRELATLVEQAYDEHPKILWLLYEHVTGTDLGALLEEEDTRLNQARWLASLLADLSALLHSLHRHGLIGLSLAPALVGLRGRSKARAKSGPPRLALLELRYPRLYGEQPAELDEVHELGLLFVRMLSVGADSSHAGARMLVDNGKWRDLEGLDAGLQLVLEQMLSPDPALRIDSTMLRDESARLSASLRETRREPTPLRTVRNAAALAQPPRMARPPASARPLSRESVRSYRPTEDIPTMRPEELSRELSSAQRAATGVQAAPKQNVVGIVLLSIMVALMTALLLALALS